MRWLRTIGLLAALAAIAAVTLWEAEERLSPGPLHPAHQRVPELAAGEGCTLCHGNWGDAEDGMARACGACHEEVLAQLSTARGLHGSLEGARAADCGSCHREHHGDALALLDAVSWQRGGVEDSAAYAHQHVADFGLHGAHDQLPCAACHEHADADPLSPAALRFLGADPRCVACHTDAHDGAFGSDCKRCHGQEQPFLAAPGFAHDAFLIDGAHRTVACSGCHDEVGGLLEGPGLDSDSGAVRRCADCHTTPHGPDGDAMRVRRDGARDCARCHDTASFAGASFGVAEHAARGVLLRGSHARADCAACHAAEQTVARIRDGLSASEVMSRCADCHPDPHREALRALALEDSSCAPCHTDQDRDFASGRLVPEQHHRVATGFPLTAPHDALGCAACHGVDPEADVSYAMRHPGRSPEDCRSCHGDPHRGQFDSGPVAERLDASAGAAVGERPLTDCLRCHQSDAFTPHRFGLELHGAATGFALEGSHRAVDCSGCHGARKDAAPRPFRGAPVECAECHADPHAGRFDGARLPAEFGGRRGCARCHDSIGFRELHAAEDQGFDHGLWTGYTLEGGHSTADCSDCHGRDANGSLGAAPERCADCHDDIHAGQFASWIEGRRTAPADCARCHARQADDFRIERFDHARLTRFALDEVHREVDCDSCHRPVEAGGGAVVTRYRPLPTDCRSCHLPTGGRGDAAGGVR